MTDTTTPTTAITAEIARLAELPRTETVGQRAYLRVSPDSVTLATQHRDVNGTPSDEWHGLVDTISLPSGVTPAAVAAWLGDADISALLIRVMDGLDSRWGGSNHIGTHTDDAAAAYLELTGEDGTAPLEWFTWEGGEIVSELDASDYLDAIWDDIARAATVEAAISEALSTLDEDGVSDVMDGPVYIGTDAAEQYARNVWTEAQDTDD